MSSLPPSLRLSLPSQRAILIITTVVIARCGARRCGGRGRRGSSLAEDDDEIEDWEDHTSKRRRRRRRSERDGEKKVVMMIIVFGSRSWGAAVLGSEGRGGGRQQKRRRRPSWGETGQRRTSECNTQILKRGSRTSLSTATPKKLTASSNRRVKEGQKKKREAHGQHSRLFADCAVAPTSHEEDSLSPPHPKLPLPSGGERRRD